MPWDLNGNVVAGTNFLGTTNEEALVVKTSNTERLRVDKAGNVGIGIGNATPASKLEVKASDPAVSGLTSSADAQGVIGESTGDGDGVLGRTAAGARTGVFGINISEKPARRVGGNGVFGLTIAIGGRGVFGANISARGVGVQGNGPERGVSGFSENGSGAVGESINGDGVLGHTDSGARSGVFGIHSSKEDAQGVGGNGVFGLTEAKGGRGVFGANTSKTGVGVQGNGPERGVSGFSENGIGVFGESTQHEGVRGQSHSTHGGVVGLNDSPEGGQQNNPDGAGVYGQSVAPSASGVFGFNPNGFGVTGRGVFGVVALGHDNAGVFCTGSPGIQARASQPGGLAGDFIGNVAIAGFVSCVGSPGIFASASNDPGALAGEFEGPVFISGALLKAGGGFRIDHPADASNKYLSHSFVESSDMKNVYDGVAVLSAKGEATVKMPSWFEVLNRDFRYQLTAIGAPSPNLHIAKGISKNAFVIAGGKPKMKVSWQITGIRKDRWAQKNRIQVEERKPARERGYYLHPRLHGQPEEKSISRARQSELMERMKKAPRAGKGLLPVKSEPGDYLQSQLNALAKVKRARGVSRSELMEQMKKREKLRK